MRCNNTDVNDITYNGLPVQSWIHNGVEVFSFGRIVTYICNGVTYEEVFRSGEDCLHPTSFIPTMEGGTFLGWCDTPDGDVLTEKIVESSPITLYAAFKIPFVIWGELQNYRSASNVFFTKSDTQEHLKPISFISSAKGNTNKTVTYRSDIILSNRCSYAIFRIGNAYSTSGTPPMYIYVDRYYKDGTSNTVTIDLSKGISWTPGGNGVGTQVGYIDITNTNYIIVRASVTAWTSNITEIIPGKCELV